MPSRRGPARSAAIPALVLVGLIFASPWATPSVSARPLDAVRGTLDLAPGADRLVPADGSATTTIVATVRAGDGGALTGRPVLLRPRDATAGVTVNQARQLTGTDGSASFVVGATVPGPVTFELFDRGRGANLTSPLAELAIDFTRKVVLLAPGFGSRLADRFTIFGAPGECADPAAPRSLYEGLVCLGYVADELLDGSIGNATIVDMSWEAAPCRPADYGLTADCVATIARSADGTDVHWRPPAYDLTSFALSMARQANVDVWAERLARTIATYDAELYAAKGIRASFYLLGHSLGGEVVVRTLRTLTGASPLAGSFAGDGRGLLQTVVSVDGALNWTGGIGFFGDRPYCGLPVHTVADLNRRAENVAAVERAFDLFGTRTVAITSAADPIVGPAVALLGGPLAPAIGYSEAAFHLDGSGTDCSHSTLLWPEPAATVRYPLHDLLIEQVGAASGTSATALAGTVASQALSWPLALRRG